MNSSYRIRSVGGALMVTIPQYVARVLKFNKGDEVKITIANTGRGGVMVTERVKPTKGKSK